MTEYLEDVLRATEFAARAHDGAHRKNPVADPYVVHPMRVARILASAGFGNKELFLAAILHDVVEDTTATLQDIEKVFGGAVARLVAEVTDDKTLSQVERKKAQVVHVATMSQRAAAIKLADAIDNLTDMQWHGAPRGWSLAKIQGYFAWKALIAKQRAGVHPPLDATLQTIFAGSVCVDGVLQPVIPPDRDLETLVAEYYVLLEEEACSKVK